MGHSDGSRRGRGDVGDALPSSLAVETSAPGPIGSTAGRRQIWRGTSRRSMHPADGEWDSGDDESVHVSQSIMEEPSASRGVDPGIVRRWSSDTSQLAVGNTPSAPRPPSSLSEVDSVTTATPHELWPRGPVLSLA